MPIQQAPKKFTPAQNIDWLRSIMDELVIYKAVVGNAGIDGAVEHIENAIHCIDMGRECLIDVVCER